MRPPRITTPSGKSVLVPPPDRLEQGHYRVRFAGSLSDLDAVLRLRYEVFNLELGEGLDSSHETGRDQDPFDAVCHHLVVEDLRSGAVIGTYRMQTEEMARARGFYSAGEFELDDLPPDVRAGAVEIGRACIAAAHRNRHVLFLLWKGLALYVARFRKRYLFGCCSLSGTDPRVGAGAFRHLEAAGHLHPSLRVRPLAALACDLKGEDPAPFGEADVPRLFHTYLRYGAKACGPPAIDRQFKTIDFLVVFDVEAMDRDLFRLYF